MVDTGSLNIVKARPYEDLTSLKKWIRSTPSYYDKDNFREILMNVTMASSGTGDEIEADDGIKISYIGRTEVTLELSAAGNEATHNTVVFSLTWEDADGNEYTSEATGTATLSDTPVAFATPVATSVYKVTAFTASADFDNQDVYAMVNAGKVFATISAAGSVTEATEAQLMGVGDIYGRSHTEHGDADSKVHYLEYTSGQSNRGVKYAVCTGTTTSADEIRFYEGTYDADTDIVTAGTTSVKDFYRVRRLWTATTPTSNSHEWLLTDDDIGVNLDGSGDDIYGLIMEGKYEMYNTRYCTPAGYDAWVGKIDCWASYLAQDFYILNIQYKKDNCIITEYDQYEFAEELHHSKPIKLEELEDVIFLLGDTDAAASVTTEFIIVEAKRY